jgi:hypothetical protein
LSWSIFILSKLSKFRILLYSKRSKSVILGNFSKNCYVWATQWPTSSELKIKFDPSLDRSWPEFLKIIKNHGPKNPTPGCNLGQPRSGHLSGKKCRLSCPVWRCPWCSIPRVLKSKAMHECTFCNKSRYHFIIRNHTIYCIFKLVRILFYKVNLK